MTATIEKGSTLIAFGNFGSYVFYGENARKAAKVLKRPTQMTPRGIEYLLINEPYPDTAEPKLVAAGYKIAILEA